MFEDCVGKRSSLGVVLSYGSCKLFKMPNYGYKTPMWRAFTKKPQPG